MTKAMTRAALSVAALAVALAACAGDGDLPVSDHEHEGDDDGVELGTAREPLVAADPLSKAVTGACSTGVARGLSEQLVREIQCLRPGTMGSLQGIARLRLGASVFPFLQKPAVDGLRKVLAARPTATLNLVSALRSLPQQYLLYRWYRTGRCGIVLAASPGTSNHESGLAVDVSDNAAWRAAFEGSGFEWLGAKDPPHFDFTSGGTRLTGLSVRAFQRLWNRNHPEDRIAEDGSYGPATEARLTQAPLGGFPLGETCAKKEEPAPSSPDGGEPPAPEPEAQVDEEPGATPPDSNEDDELAPEAPLSPRRDVPRAEGCSAASLAGGARSSEGALATGLLVVGLVGARRWRRRAATGR